MHAWKLSSKPKLYEARLLHGPEINKTFLPLTVATVDKINVSSDMGQGNNHRGKNTFVFGMRNPMENPIHFLPN